MQPKSVKKNKKNFPKPVDKASVLCYNKVRSRWAEFLVLCYNITSYKINQNKSQLGVDFILGRCYINNITCVRGHCRRNGRGREKRKRAIGWPNSDL